MIVLDANVLLYAYNADAPQHMASRKWLEDLFAGMERIGIPWVTLWAFVRISTNPRLHPAPLPTPDAFRVVRALLAHPNVTAVAPGPRHAEILERIAVVYQASDSLLTDAVLAALAIENGGAIASTNRGFARFSELRWMNPLAGE